MEPVFTIIVPCFNYGHYLPFTLNSVKKQTFLNWECIIVDDGSTDNTKSVCEKFIELDKRFRYIYQTNKGLASARNKGIEYSNGSFIQLLDSDDLISEKKLETQYEIIKNKDIDILIGVSVLFDEKKTYSFPYIFEEGIIINPMSYLVHDNIIPVSAPIFKKNILGKIGLFNEQLNALEDWDFWLRAAINRCHFFYESNSNSLTLIRQHNNSMKTNTNIMLINQLFIRISLKKGNYLIKEFIAINNTEINSLIKTILYNNSQSPKLLSSQLKNVISIKSDLRLHALYFCSNFLKITIKPKLIWLLFERKKGSIKKIIKNSYILFREIIEKKFPYKFMAIKNEEKYLIFNNERRFSGIDNSNLSNDLQRDLDYLNHWVDDEYILYYPKPCKIEPVYGWIITASMELLPHSLPYSYRNSKWSQKDKPNKFDFYIRPHKCLKFDKVIHLNHLFRFGVNYFVFLNSLLGEIWLLEKFGIDTTIPILVPEKIFNTSFFKQSLRISSKIGSYKWIPIDSKTYVNANEIYMAKNVDYISDHLKDIASWFDVNKFILPPFEKLFIIRNKKNIRYLTNVNEVINIVAKYGFVSIDSEELNLEEQIKVFSGIKKLIAIHGAGVTNMIFSYPSLDSFFEIFSGEKVNGGFRLMSHSFNVKYNAIIGTHSVNDKFTIDIEEFERSFLTWYNDESKT